MISKLTCAGALMLCICSGGLAVLAQDKTPEPEKKEETKAVTRLEVPADYAKKEAPDLKDATRIARGKELYIDPAKANCSMCHGDGGKGDGLQAANYRDPKVSDLTSAEFYDAVTDQYIFWRIKDVQASKANINSSMLGYPTGTDEDLWAVVAYVRSLKVEPVKILTRDEFKDVMTDIKAANTALGKAAKARDAEKAAAEAQKLVALADKLPGSDHTLAEDKKVRDQEDYKKFVDAFRKAAEEYAKLAKAGDWKKADEKQPEIGDGCGNCHDVYKKKW